MDKRAEWKGWEKTGDPHKMNRIRWDQKELDFMREIFNQDWFGYGNFNRSLEQRLADFTGIPRFNLTNSGSTALTTAVKALFHRGTLKRGDLILHPITTFPTSISGAIDYGLVPVFIETRKGTYVVDEEQIERAIQKYPEIKGMILPHLLGNIPNMDKILGSLGARVLIEDCCDTLGGYFDGQHVGSFGDFMALSFYGSHHITAGGVGGAVGTKSEINSQLARSIIFWGHDYDTHTGGTAKKDFLARYDCTTIGSDFQLSALQAAFALAQMDRLKDFIKERETQFKEMQEIFKPYEKAFELPTSDPLSKPSWFCYPLTVKEAAKFKREDFVSYLTKNGVETRPIMCGNILRQKPYNSIERVTLDGEKFPIGDEIQKNGLFIPCWGMPENQKKDYYKILSDFLKKIS